MQSNNNFAVYSHQERWNFDKNYILFFYFKFLLCYQPIYPSATFQSSGKIKYTKDFTYMDRSTKSGCFKKFVQNTTPINTG